MKPLKTILITGAAGFIGSNVLEHLFYKYPRYRFWVLDALTYAGDMRSIPEEIQKSGRFAFWYGDVRNAKIVDALVSQSDVVMHFAAESHVTRSIYDNLRFFETDVIGTQVIANAVSAHQPQVERFIHISTCEVYGSAQTVPMNEDHPLNPHSPYAAAKAGADRLVYSYIKTYNIPAVIVRPFNVFGPRQHLEKVVPRFITGGLLREPLTVHGPGKSRRDFMYVDDLANALDLLIHAPREKVIRQIFNVGSGKSVGIREIADKVSVLMALPPKQIVHIGDRPGQVENFVADYGKIHRLLGWKPRVTFENGLIKTIRWYKQNRDWWKDKIWMRHVPILTRDGKVEHH